MRKHIARGLRSRRWLNTTLLVSVLMGCSNNPSEDSSLAPLLGNPCTKRSEGNREYGGEDNSHARTMNDQKWKVVLHGETTPSVGAWQFIVTRAEYKLFLRSLSAVHRSAR